MSIPQPKPVTFVSENALGERQETLLPGPGGTIRVAVGEPGKQSGVWRIWANRKTSDVYIAARSIAGHQKWSLHESGDWRNQWVAGRHPLGADANRIIDRWSRPPEVGGAGWTKGMSIWVRHSDVVPYEDAAQKPKDISWIPEPEIGKAAGIHVVFGRPDSPPAEFKGMVPIDAFVLADGNVVMVLASWVDLPPEVNDDLEAHLKRAATLWKESDMTDVTTPRVWLSGFGEDDHHFIWDLAEHSLRTTENAALEA